MLTESEKMQFDQIDDIINWLISQIGYLEKSSNHSLDNKTANAGTANYTIYAQHLAATDLYNGNKQGQAWCCTFAADAFVQTFGAASAREMLCLPVRSLGAACRYWAKYYRQAGRYYSTPQIGDHVFFGTPGSESHVGTVVEIKGGRIYTIEGNTSGASGVIANGGGVCKKSYPVGYSKISGYGRPRWTETQTAPSTAPKTWRTIRKGDNNDDVREAQQRLIAHGYPLIHYGADGDFGSETDVAVRCFQRDHGLAVDGVIGPKTWAKLLAAPIDEDSDIYPEIKKGDNGDFVVLAQNLLIRSGHSLPRYGSDGDFGGETDAAVRQFQRAKGLTADGIIGPKTWAALLEA